MTKIEDFRQLCQNWINALTEEVANAIADEIDSIANTDSARWLSLLRQIERTPKLSIIFKHASHGRILERTCHPKFGSRKSGVNVKEKIHA